MRALHAERCKMRKKDDTLRSNLLNLARNIADEKGIDAINIRAIANKAGVATGTVYNYFSNKDEILLALTEEYWKQTLIEMKRCITADSFCEQLQEMFDFLRKQIDQSAGKLMSSLGNMEAAAQERMLSMQSELASDLILYLEQDNKIREDIWNDAFTKKQFAQFIMMNMIMLLKMKTPDFEFFIKIIKGIIE